VRPTVCRCPAGCVQSRSGRVRAVPVKLARRTARSWRAIRDSLQRARPGPSPRSNRTAFDGDLVEQCSAYACPVHAYARSPRLEADPCPSACNRSSPATSRRVHPAYACVRSVDRGARKSPEKLGSSTRPPARTRWSQRCAYAKYREEPDELVAGVTRQGEASGCGLDESAGHGVCPMQAPGRCTTQRRPFAFTVPRNSQPRSTFGSIPDSCSSPAPAAVLVRQASCTASLSRAGTSSGKETTR